MVNTCGMSAPKARAVRARLGQMHLDEVAVAAAEAGERMQALDHAGALGPAAAHAGGVGHHGHLPGAQRGLAVPAAVRRRPPAASNSASAGTSSIFVLGRQPVHGETDAPAAQVGADLLVLRAVEAVFGQQLVEAAGLRRGGGRGQHPVEQRRQHGGELRPAARRLGELLQVGALARA